MASAREPEPGGSVKPSLGAGLTTGAGLTILAQLFQDPYKTIIQGIAGVVGPLVMGAWPRFRRYMSHGYRQVQTERAIKRLRKLIRESEQSKSSEEHIAELRGRLERAEIYLADVFLEEGLIEEEEEEPVAR